MIGGLEYKVIFFEVSSAGGGCDAFGLPVPILISDNRGRAEMVILGRHSTVQN